MKIENRWTRWYYRHLNPKISYFSEPDITQVMEIGSQEHIWTDNQGNCIKVPQHNSTDSISPAERNS